MPPAASPLDDAQSAPPCPEADNPYYLAAVAALARKRPVVAQEDIYTSQGMKLVARGSQLSQLQFERLAQHKLTVAAGPPAGQRTPHRFDDVGAGSLQDYRK